MNSPNKSIKTYRLLWGSVAFGIYFIFIALLLFYFNHHERIKPKHFVKKDDKRIEIATIYPPSSIKVNKIVQKSTDNKEKPKTKVLPEKAEKVFNEKVHVKNDRAQKHKIKKHVMKKDTNKTKFIKAKLTKKIEKKRPIKKAKKHAKHEINKPARKTSDLFSSLNMSLDNTKVAKAKKISKPNEKKLTASQKIAQRRQKEKSMDSGIQNVYFSKVQTALENWPAQSDYAGEKAKVVLFVKPTGMFEFKIKSISQNVDFNLSLTDFLLQLQKLGLGRHTGNKTYEIEVEFVAKE